MGNIELLLEKLAKLEHEQWQAWARVRNSEHPLVNVPYELLTEPQKEQDRFWARKVLTIITDQKTSPCMTPEQLRRIQEGKDNDGTCPSYNPITHRCAEDPTIICGDEHAVICLTRIEAKRRKYKLRKEEPQNAEV